MPGAVIFGFVLGFAPMIGGCGGGDGATPPRFQARITLEFPQDDPGGAVIALIGLPGAALDALRDASPARDEWISVLRVTVRQPDGVSNDIPAVLGDYEVGDDEIVRFRPMVPFDPGREYDVRFDPTGLPTVDPSGAADPVIEVVSLPRPEIEATTVVSRVFPSGTRVPENQLRVHIEFSAPMSDVAGLEHIHLLDSRGDEVETPFLPPGEESWDHDYRRYTLFFDLGRVENGIRLREELGRPLTAGESYTLVVDADWPDADGAPLKEESRKDFTVGSADETPLDTATWRLRVPSPGTTSRLVVSFPEPLDQGLLLRGLAVEDAGGTRLDGEAGITNWETRWSFTPARPWTAGAYSLVALSILEDLAGNRIGLPFEIDVDEQIDEPADQVTYRIPFEIGG